MKWKLILVGLVVVVCWGWSCSRVEAPSWLAAFGLAEKRRVPVPGAGEVVVEEVVEVWSVVGVVGGHALLSSGESVGLGDVIDGRWKVVGVSVDGVVVFADGVRVRLPLSPLGTGGVRLGEGGGAGEALDGGGDGAIAGREFGGV